MELARRPTAIGYHSRLSQSAKQALNKQGQQPRTVEEKLVPYYGQPPTGVPYYPRQTYNNNKPQYASRPFVPQGIPQGNHPLLLESGSGSASPKPSRKPSSTNQKKPFKKRVSWRKPVAYATTEKENELAATDEEATEDKLNKAPDPDSYYVKDPDLNYYNPSYPPDEEEDAPTALSALPIYIYRRYQAEFKSNNLLHKHIRDMRYIPKPLSLSTLPAAFHRSVKIIPSTAPITNLETGFSFRNYHFLTLFVALDTFAVAISICMNSGYSVTLINRAFLLKQAPGTHVRTITSPISIREIGTNHHSTNEYMLLDIYFPDKRDGKDMRAKITREAHLIDNLKAKMLLGTDIIGPERIDIITSKNQAFISSYDTTVDIDFKPRSRGLTIKPVVADKETMVPPRSQMVVPMHHASLPDDRDFLFEPSTEAVSLYTHLVNDTFHSVLARNDSDEPVLIPRHLRLGSVSKVDYDNCYHAAPEIANLAIASAKEDEP